MNFKEIDYYLYNDYLKYLKVNSENDGYYRAFSIIPYYYYRNKFKILSTSKKYDINHIKEKILNSEYSFLLELDGFVKNPEFLHKKDLLKIENILSNNKNDFYALNAYVIYYYNKGKLNLNEHFKKLLTIEKNNPHILVRYARYNASTLYKRYKDKKYLELGKKNILLAIEQFNNREIPTFFYSWLGYIEHELGNYNNAIELYEKVIDLNKKLLIDVPEPYVWKVFSLNKLGEYKKSLDLGLIFLKDDILNKDDDKRDFRLYKVLADNCYNLGKYKEFYKYLRITIEKFLEIFNFHFNNKLKLNNKNNLLILTNEIEKNKYNSFLKYNKKYINDKIDNIIFSIAYLYKEKLLGNNIAFNDSRGIEKLCFNYLRIIYDGKIK